MVDKEKLNFDEALQKLEEIVKRIQDGEVKISDLKAEVADAMVYVRFCKEELDSIKKDLENIDDK